MSPSAGNVSVVLPSFSAEYVLFSLFYLNTERDTYFLYNFIACECNTSEASIFDDLTVFNSIAVVAVVSSVIVARLTGCYWIHRTSYMTLHSQTQRPPHLRRGYASRATKRSLSVFPVDSERAECLRWSASSSTREGFLCLLATHSRARN